MRFKWSMPLRLSTVLILLLLLSVPVFSLENVDSDAGLSPDYASSTSVISYPELEAVISEGVKNLADKIDISAFKIPISKRGYLEAYFSNVKRDNPEYFYLSGEYSMHYIGNYYTAIVPGYTMDAEEIKTKNQAIESECANILSSLRDDMSDVEKMLAVYDYFCVNYEYDYENYENDTIPPESYTLVGVMVNKIGVCQSYSFAYEFVLNRLGIECSTVSSEPMRHMWNLVKLDGKWYHVDVTWGDPTYDKCGNVSHKYFLVSDDTMKDFEHRHHSWSTNVECNDKTYEDAAWVKSTSAVAFDDENIYFSLPTGEINSMDRDTGKIDTIYIVRDYWPAHIAGNYYVDKFHKISLVGEKIYFNLPKCIMSVTTDGSMVQTEFRITEEGYVFGMYEKDDKIYYGLSKDSNKYIPVTGSFELKEHFSIKLRSPEGQIGAGQSFALDELVESGYSTGELAWSLSDNSVAKISDGRLLLRKKGSVIVRVALASDPSVYAETTIDISIVYGDADKSGSLDSSDIVMIAQHIARWNIEISDEALELCDVYHDGDISSMDIVLMAQFIAGWDVSLG